MTDSISVKYCDPKTCERCNDQTSDTEKRNRPMANKKNLPEMVNCDWCANELVHRYAVKYNGELIGKRCKRYAWAAIVKPETYEANRAIAVRRFANN